MRIFVNYVFKDKRTSIELPAKLVELFNHKYPNQSIGRFITQLLKTEKGNRVGSSLVLCRLVEELV
ncbi:hypothetical protein SB8_01235 [Pseudomonas oryzihabitans]|nr:hypothetical protein SB8_01235 [Pseudomonas psychrotolerans]